MRSHSFRLVVILVGVLGIALVGVPVPRAAGQQTSDADWKAVEQALGKSGQLMPGDVFRVAMPRTDLKVKVQGVDVKAGFALGSYAAFKKMGNEAMVMGDLVLLDEGFRTSWAGCSPRGSPSPPFTTTSTRCRRT